MTLLCLLFTGPVDAIVTFLYSVTKACQVLRLTPPPPPDLRLTLVNAKLSASSRWHTPVHRLKSYCLLSLNKYHISRKGRNKQVNFYRTVEDSKWDNMRIMPCSHYVRFAYRILANRSRRVVFILLTTDPMRTVRVPVTVYTLRLLRDRLWPIGIHHLFRVMSQLYHVLTTCYPRKHGRKSGSRFCAVICPISTFYTDQSGTG